MIKKVQEALAEIPSFKRVVVGLSGGPDSVALAHALNRLGYDVILAHLNHNLRGLESEMDQVFVEHLAEDWGLPIVSTRLNMPKKGNLENHCRQIRYEFLEEVRKKYHAKYIAIAHHQKDQVESILMHIERGAGQRGMCGMYLHKNKLIRPFLNLQKEALLDYLDKHNLPYRIDSSNHDLGFKRNYVRYQVIPKLEKKWAHFQENLIQLSEIAKKRLKKNQQRAKQWSTRCIKNKKFNRENFLRLSENVQSEILFQILGYQDVYRQSIKELKQLIKEGKTGKQKTIKHTTFIIEYDHIHFLENTKETPLKKVELKNKTKWGEWILNYKGGDKLFVRAWKSGDRFEPNGMEGSKKVQDFFVDAKIPQKNRHQIPIITNKKGEILSVGDLRLSKKGTFLKTQLSIKKYSSNPSK